jgi:hypothetical protein
MAANKLALARAADPRVQPTMSKPINMPELSRRIPTSLSAVQGPSEGKQTSPRVEHEAIRRPEM